MTQRPLTLQTLRADHCRSGLLLRCLLLLAVWQGPIPVYHSHGTLASAGENCGDTLGLLQHLKQCHASVNLFAKIDFGWHLHFELPRDRNSSDKSQQSSATSSHCADLSEPAPDAGLRLASPSTLNPLAAPLPLALSGLLTHSASATQRAHFHDSFAPQLALPVRFGVARC